MSTKKRRPSNVKIWTKTNDGGRHERLVTLVPGRSVDEELDDYAQEHKACCDADRVDYQID